MRHLNNGTDNRHSKSCCDQSSPARRTIIVTQQPSKPPKAFRRSSRSGWTASASEQPEPVNERLSRNAKASERAIIVTIFHNIMTGIMALSWIIMGGPGSEEQDSFSLSFIIHILNATDFWIGYLALVSDCVNSRSGCVGLIFYFSRPMVLLKQPPIQPAKQPLTSVYGGVTI